jgi:L-lactate permease
MPFLLVKLLASSEGLQIEYSKEWKKMLGASLCFYLPVFVVAWFSVELPSVAGGGIGFILFSLIFLPQDEISALFRWMKKFSPYLFFIGLLLVWKYFSKGIDFEFHSALKSLPAYQPGLIFIISAFFLSIYLEKANGVWSFLKNSFHTIKSIKSTILSLFVLIAFTQMMAPNLPMLTKDLISIPGSALVFIQPLIGVFGSFITGSSTMNNLLFAESTTAFDGQFKALLLALLHSGGMAGNAISLQNILMVKSVVSAPVSENEIFKANLFVIFVLWLSESISGLLIFHFLYQELCATVAPQLQLYYRYIGKVDYNGYGNVIGYADVT